MTDERNEEYLDRTKASTPSRFAFPSNPCSGSCRRETSLSRHRRVLVAISGHGYGHLGQISPLINGLQAAVDELELVLQCALPEVTISERIGGTFTHVPFTADVGMIMNGPLRVVPEATLAAYAEFHERWDDLFAEQVAILEREKPALVIADVPYLPLSAAQHLGVPNVAVCSLNWVDILQGYCAEDEQTRPWFERMRSAYRGAEIFLKPAPAMPMEWLANGQDIGPLAATGRDRSRDLRRRLELDDETRLVLITLGGIESSIPFDVWAEIPGVFWLTARMTSAPAGSGAPLSSIADIPFIDVMASVDAVVTKPGYGIFTEAACHGVPLLYIPRGDWPEEPHLCAWLERRGVAFRITDEDLAQGKLAEALEHILSRPTPAKARPTGISDGVGLLMPFID